MGGAKTKRSKHIFLFLRIAVVVCGIIWGIFWLSGEQLFCRIDLEFQGDLDKGIISKRLQQEFKNSSLPLSQNATISVEQKGSRWLITDDRQTYTISISKEQGELNIYSERWEILVEIFRQMNLGIFAAVLSVFILANLIIALRWWLLLRTQSIYIEYWPAVRLHFLGLFYNNFMPSSVGGDVIRAWYVTKHTDKKFEAVLSVFVDRVIGLLSTLIIAAFFSAVFLRAEIASVLSREESGSLTFLAESKWVLVWVLVALMAVFCGLLSARRGRALLAKVWLSIRTHSLRLFEKLKNAIIVYCSKPLVILTVFGLTVCLQIMTITAFWFLGRNLGITASVKYYYVFFTLTWVFGAVPVSVGGAVIVEGLLAWFFIQFAGVGTLLAGALALCQRAVWMLASLPGAVIHLIGAHLPKDFFIDYDKPVN